MYPVVFSFTVLDLFKKDSKLWNLLMIILAQTVLQSQKITIAYDGGYGQINVQLLEFWSAIYVGNFGEGQSYLSEEMFPN